MDSCSPTILHVDDCEANRYAIGRLLERSGFTVRQAATGAEALEHLEQRPDLVLLDVNLPDISGYEICRRIKADPELASVSVLQTSAVFVRTEDRVFGLDGGADAYLCSPIDVRELVATIQALLRTREERDALRQECERLRSAAAAREASLAELAHEARSPLAAVSNVAHRLGQIAPGDPGVTELRRVIQRQVAHLTSLMEALSGGRPADPARQGAEAAPPLASAPQQERRVLVVEDNRDAADTLADLLELWGHTVCLTRTGEEALRLAPGFRPEVALINLGLPGLTGYDVAERLRRDSRLQVSDFRGAELEAAPVKSSLKSEIPNLKSLLLVALTGYAQADYRRRSELAGFDYHLVKPVEPEALRRLLEGHGLPA